MLSQIRFGSTINLAGPPLNLTMPRYKVMGVPSLDMIGIEVRTLREPGFKRSVIRAPDLGLSRARFEDLASSRDVERDAIALLRVIIGRDDGPRSDIVCLNAAPLLYVMGKARNLKEGIG